MNKVNDVGKVVTTLLQTLSVHAIGILATRRVIGEKKKSRL